MPRHFRKSTKSGPRVSKSVKKYVSKRLKTDGEVHRQCLSLGNTALAVGTWQFLQCVQIAQGDQDDHRSGLEVDGIGFRIRLPLISPVDRIARVRIMVVKSKIGLLVNGDMPASDHDCITPQMRAKYSVAYDRAFQLRPRSTGAGQDGNIKMLNLYVPDKRRLHFTGTTLADTRDDNQVYVCAFVSSYVGTGTGTASWEVDCNHFFREY